ncbi:MAG: 50S ribosomal protein L7/L12 [bacterium (Candidatus Ratteibacteria) CG_4_10_14_3_um_filter_41_18]|uniref:Large ribosomal subunit protein bL12 n=4 Tax=Candidatus Ratteibacteria TaxID=2979319 RepID=A0A2M7YEL8_9BACT|nr:MAG: 50S ribosomal protein L7/L12 [bacterium (Candidatus Ratteibacteria) CG01_land_8_20_14_3_00_40_19]PIW31045.1 MAG: 50S ribosomal protein L7/L12 [bacterium (Candidatus Ratteibacteria) CG15_BIG_FIL_POST_REV_8_21_14_020_41_12]PIW74209.1 MAG: 50S ribosomal protein L7/L12 [bacterium (Candidatus Ratteibacteria) CG_4_8_14_3_um_filter_41_36]PIX76716.1 MAG: 50S ribosomal protein L7/L12 [bacterium (Candidatus Ratteibacteria) CG_4_10_14_3_um_filter_41_18]PJA61424.1 MAG: 50S ribosomal protein L7/L12 
MIAEKKVVKSAKKEKKVVEKKGEKTISKEDFVAAIGNMNILELSELIKALEEKFGVSASFPVAASPQASAGGEAPAKEEEKTSFDVILTEVGEKKIPVIKEIRSITNLGLKESKDFVESAPKPIKEKIEKKEAEEIKKKLEAVGAKVEIK